MISRPFGRPIGLWILTFGLLLSPLFHLLARITDKVWLNFGNPSSWDLVVYLLIAPMVGFLLLARHERARFATYIFLSCELLRAQRVHSWGLALLAVTAIAYLQLPAMRRIHPSIRPHEVLARMGLGQRSE